MTKELNLSYREVHKEIPWMRLMRMLADMPREVWVTKKQLDKRKNIELTEQTSDDFKQYIDDLNRKQKKK